QKKCLGKMDDVAKEGRTVLFVSHQMQSVMRLSPRTLLLDRGQLIESGATAQVVGAYLNSGFGLVAEKSWRTPEVAPGDDLLRLNIMRVRNERGETQELFDSRESIGIEIGYTVSKTASNLAAEFVAYDATGQLLF